MSCRNQLLNPLHILCKKSTFIFSVESPLKNFARKYDGAHGHVMNFDLGMSHFYSRGITLQEICGGFTSGKVRLTSMTEETSSI